MMFCGEVAPRSRMLSPSLAEMTFMISPNPVEWRTSWVEFDEELSETTGAAGEAPPRSHLNRPDVTVPIPLVRYRYMPLAVVLATGAETLRAGVSGLAGLVSFLMSMAPLK